MYSSYLGLSTKHSLYVQNEAMSILKKIVPQNEANYLLFVQIDALID